MKRKNILVHKKKYSILFDKISNAVTKAAGSAIASVSSFVVIIIWALSGPFFNFSDTWQLVINTGTTIITFLMVFIIQQSQNKDTTAIQLKLNELIACNANASNRLIVVEDLTEEELMVLKKFYIQLSQHAQKEADIHLSHSLDEAEDNQERKTRLRKQQ